MTPGAAWLSATSVGRLLHCPASASFTSAPDPIPPSRPENAGTLAHLAMNAWVESGAWLRDAPGTALHDSWDSEATHWGVDAMAFADSVMTRSRLRSRGAELAALLRSAGGSARSEVFMRDSAQLLYGQIDLAVDAEQGGAVVDLKTGADGHSESVRTQLLIYAHLFREEVGHFPRALVAFSLRHGAVHIDFSEGEVEDVLEQVQAAARKHPSLALPDRAGCRFCRRRLRCDPHWEAASGWEDADCVEGVITKLESAATGLIAIRVATIHGQEWITGLASSAGEGMSLGDAVRFTEVAGRGEQLGREWRATRSTRSATA